MSFLLEASSTETAIDGRLSSSMHIPAVIVDENPCINNDSRQEVETSSFLQGEEDGLFKWTPVTVLQSVALFCLAGIAEIVGGWLVWMAIRGNSSGRRPWWYAFIGSLVLILYGFIPTLQPTDNFGRIYAVYGGFFIVGSFLFGWALDGGRPDIGDLVGGAISLVGVCIIMFWPR
jgi:drug/metabolite transporter superfamily protein YnfA